MLVPNKQPALILKMEFIPWTSKSSDSIQPFIADEVEQNEKFIDLAVKNIELFHGLKCMRLDMRVFHRGEKHPLVL